MSSVKSFSFIKNKTRIEGLAEVGEYKDTELKGFILRVRESSKVFQVRKKSNGKDIRVKIGEFPALNVKQARDKALEILSLIAKGINPNEQKKQHVNSSVTLEKVFNDYIASKELKVNTLRGYKQIINCYLIGWKNRPLIHLNEDEAIKLHKDISKRSKAQADYMSRLLRALFNYAKYEYRGKDRAFIFVDNPVKILSHKKEWNRVARKQTLIRPSELKCYLLAINQVRNNPENNQFSRSVCDAVEFALFTGLRKMEVLSIEWERVNLKSGYFWIDATKNGDPLELPITNTLSTILKRRWANKDKTGKYVFTGLHNGLSIKEPKYVLEKINNATESFTDSPLTIHWHDLRRTFATIADSENVTGYKLKRLLNHRATNSADVTAGYVVQSAEELREPARVVEQAILKHAGMIIEPVKEKGIDHQLTSLLDGMSDQKKRELIFQLARSEQDRKITNG
ncbi:integrase family protein [Pseudoalteromonas agarivorans]|uniref:tyrosine-type recombinase/integrase n=1 Tax=Pseudoalteromonas agarivorans TaxID=176102 RepID=UPI00311F1535